MKFVFTLCSLMVGGFLFGNPMDSLRTEQRAEGRFVIHQVEEKETLYSLAKRYGGTVQGIIKYNELSDNRIEIGQVIQILIEEREEKVSKVMPVQIKGLSTPGIHVVQQGETLYSISKKYDVKLKELRKWNGLEGNDLSLGMQLKVASDAVVPAVPMDSLRSTEATPVEVEVDTVREDAMSGFDTYLVQAGETLSTISIKIGVSMDSLKQWNSLVSDYLKIGQQLYFKGSDGSTAISEVEVKKKTRTRIDEDGFEKVYEEGVAAVIEAMNTARFLALHRTLPIGTNLEVRNLMNNQVVHVKVVGKLPPTGLNKNLLLRLSQPAYDQLGILDPKSRVEVSYFK